MIVLINMTYEGRSADYRAQIDPGMSDVNIRRICEEAVRGGEVPELNKGLPRNAFANFVIDRFNGNDGVRLVLRPKVPFG